MGADFARKEASLALSDDHGKGTLGVGVGERTTIEDAIIDKNAKIGSDVSLSQGVEEGWSDDDLGVYVDGSRVVVKNAVVPSGTENIALFILRQRIELDMRAQ